MGTLSGAVSFALLGCFFWLTRLKKLPNWLSVFTPLVIPISVGLVHGFSAPITGMIVSLALIAVGGFFRQKSRLLELTSFFLAALVFAWVGFRIQFIQVALNGRYIYFSWLSVPLTVAWLLLIGRSVEFAHYKLGRKKPKLFLVTLLVIGTSFLGIVALQPDQNLAPAYRLGFSFIGALIGWLVLGPEKKLTAIGARGTGFVLAGLALIGVVKSLTAFVLLVPIAPLAIPAARKSLAFTRSAVATDHRSGFVDRLAGRYVGSRSLGVAIIYLSLSVIGLTSIWFLRSPGRLQGGLLGSSLVFPFLLTLAANRAVRYFRHWNPSIFEKNGSDVAAIFGTSFTSGEISQVREEIMEDVAGKNDNTSYVATPDVTAVMQAERKDLLENSFGRADVVTPDGFGLIWAALVHDLPLKERVAGIDLIEEILGTSRELEVYLLGSRSGVAEKAGERINNQYEAVTIAGTHHGYAPVKSEAVVEEINEADPDILFVGMGVPKQERWITEHIHELEANVVMGVGGSFDVISGNLPRAPRWMRDKGLEWLYRIWLEPGRIIKARWIPYFMLRVLWEKGKRTLRKEIL